MQIKIADEGVVDAPLEFMVVKDSVFIPTLQSSKAERVLHKVAKQLQFEFVYRTVVYEGFLGLRVWRTK